MKKTLLSLSLSLIVCVINLYSQDEIVSKLTINNNIDGGELLKFNTDRPWSFYNVGTGSGSTLRLSSQSNGKYFQITNYDGTSKTAIFYSTNELENTRVFLIPTGGKVGIGTTSPSEKFTIGQGGNLLLEGTGDGQILLGHSIRSTDRAEFHLHANGENSVSEIFFGSNSRDDSNVRWAFSDRGKSNGIFNIYEGPALNNGAFVARITIKKGGNVGIGTDDPKAKLSVNGTILSREIKVLADISQYPDFVFSNNYQLRSLEEVEKYIINNNHLPEIPKAEDVEEGIALGEMNIKLLQKIEELTLYIIEQNKEN